MKRYNLALNDSYELTDSFSAGGIENGTICENCNKLISNVAVVQNKDGKIFNVGMDCAKTLTNLNGLYFAELEFTELKGLQAKINKAKKGGANILSEITSDSDLRVYTNVGTTIFYKDMEFSKKYLKQYVSTCTNPQKMGFKYEHLNVADPSIREKLLTRDSFKKSYELHGYICTVEHKDSDKQNIYTTVEKNGDIVFTKRCHFLNVGNLEKFLNDIVKQILFEQYEN